MEQHAALANQTFANTHASLNSLQHECHNVKHNIVTAEDIMTAAVMKS